MARGTIITRTNKKGQKRYHAAVWVQTPDGGKKQQWKTFDKKKEAEAFLDARSKEVREGDYVEPEPIHFDQFATEWEEKYPKVAEGGGLKPSTLAGYHSVLQVHLKPFFGRYQVHQITSTLIMRDFLPGLPADMSPKTRRNILLILQLMLRTAVVWGYASRNPFIGRNGRDGVKLPKQVKEQKGRGLTPEEIKKLLEKCHDDAYTIVATAILSGMRRGELFGLKWENVDFARHQIHVKEALYYQRGKHLAEESGFLFVKPKTKGSIRSIDMSPALQRILKAHWLRQNKENNPLGLVFVNEAGNPMEPSNFTNRRFATAVRNAKIGHCRFHDLRHTYGSLKIQQGENLKYVQTQLGHASINVTVDTYGHLLKPANPDAAARTDSLIFGNAAAAG